MRAFAPLLLVIAATLVAAPADARPRKETPEKLYEQGLRQMKRGYYDEAIISFDKVRNHFPLNKYSVLSELRVADCLYEKSDFIGAVDAYQQFVRLHPQHDELDYARMRIGRSYFKQSNRIPGNDQTYTELTIRALDGFEESFPESDYIGEVERVRNKCRARVSRAEMQVGDFYYWRAQQGGWRKSKDKLLFAASRRYQRVMDDYPETPALRRALLRYGMCQYLQGEPLVAISCFEQVIEEYPGTVQARKSSRWLSKARDLAAAEPQGGETRGD